MTTIRHPDAPDGTAGAAGTGTPAATTTAPPAARLAVVLSFVALGCFWGTWAVSLADVQRTFHLSDGALGVLLSVSIAVAGVNGAVLGHHAERWGTAKMLTGALAAWAVFLVAAGAAPTLPIFVVAFLLTEVACGSVDTAMNAAANHLMASRPGALVRFHALFNTGALIGAAAAGLLLHAGLSWRWLWPSLAVGVAVLAIGTAASTRTASVRRASTEPPPPVAVVAETEDHTGWGGRLLGHLRADRLLLFLVVFALAEIIEGGVDTWGVLYLRTQLAAGVLLGAGAYVIGQSVAATTRGAGGPLLGRLSARIALVVGSLVAAGGILLESTSPVAWVAAIGLAVGAAGASLFWPLVMSDAIVSASRPTAASGAFTAAGYVGWVAGAPLIGFVSDSWGLARGLQLLAGLAVCVAVMSLLHRRRGASGTTRSPE